MKDLFNKWKTRVPRYSEEFKDIFESLSKKGGSSIKTQVNLGKHFSNNYELYMYAFFLGLYNSEFTPIPEGAKRMDFGHPIQFWGNKGSNPGRKDFSSIQENIFTALIAKTDIDLIALDKGELSEDSAIKSLIQTMESYTNGGLTLIKEKIEDNPNYFLQPTAFLNLILLNKNRTQETVDTD
jgi:hypothetical protein